MGFPSLRFGGIFPASNKSSKTESHPFPIRTSPNNNMKTSKNENKNKVMIARTVMMKSPMAYCHNTGHAHSQWGAVSHISGESYVLSTSELTRAPYLSDWGHSANSGLPSSG